MRDPWYYSRRFITDQAARLTGDVIDIGCGSAKYRQMILDLPGVETFTGLDFFAAPEVDIVADLNKALPIEDGRYDAAICISVLEHLLEPDAALGEINRVLKEGAYLLISTPWIFPYHAVPDDYYRFSRKLLEYLAEKNGFEVVYVSSTGGRMRIVMNMFVFWFPFWKKFKRFLDPLLASLDRQRTNEENPHLNTPSHHLILRKK